MKQILVHSYRSMCEIAGKIEHPHLVIRFGETTELISSVFEKNDLRRAECPIQIYDWDDVRQMEYGMEHYLFHHGNALQILRFVAKYPDIEYIYVHCHAGISRSAGCAAALAKIYNNDDKKYFLIYVPNMLIYRTILQTYYEEQQHLCLQI